MEGIVNSFTPKKTLNPKVWDLSDKQVNPKMFEDIREKLLATANQFINFLDLDLFIDDVVLTGSLCNYTWSKYSDFDLHIIIDLSEYSEDIKELYLKVFQLKKLLFNLEHDITIKNYEVELYVQESSEPHASPGVFSLFYDKWLKTPKKDLKAVNKEEIINQSNKWLEYIDHMLDNLEDEDLETIKVLTDKVKRKLSNYRKLGLEQNGELSVENLVYKLIRRKGYLEKLYDFSKKMASKKLTIEHDLNKNFISESSDKISPDLYRRFNIYI